MTRIRFDCCCDCGTGVCSRGVGQCEARGEGTVREEDFEGLQFDRHLNTAKLP